MDLYVLLTYLDLEEASQFEYFEAMADLVECEEDIEQESMYALFAGADHTTVSGLLDDYFEDIMGGLPEDSGEIYSLMEQIKMSLEGLIMNAADDSDLRRFTDEFYKFRQWYVFDSEVELLPENGGTPLHMNLRDAITAARMEKLGGDKYRYSFEDALDYELDSYTMSFADLVAAEDDYNDGTIVFDAGDEEYDGNLAKGEDRYS